MKKYRLWCVGGIPEGGVDRCRVGGSGSGEAGGRPGSTASSALKEARGG